MIAIAAVGKLDTLPYKEGIKEYCAENCANTSKTE